MRLAQQLPGRDELADFADWRVAECDRRGVAVRLGVAATAESVQAMRPDAVVIATGGRATVDGSSKFHRMPIPGAHQPWVFDHETALSAALVGARTLGRRIVILDAVGFIEAIALGELLAGDGHDVTTVCPLAAPLALDAETAGVALPRAVRAGMRWRPSTALAAIGHHRVTLVDALAGTEVEVDDIDTVVIRTHGRPDDALYHALVGQVPEIHRVGDAVAVRYCDRAIYDGHLVGRAL